MDEGSAAHQRGSRCILGNAALSFASQPAEPSGHLRPFGSPVAALQHFAVAAIGDEILRSLTVPLTTSTMAKRAHPSIHRNKTQNHRGDHEIRDSARGKFGRDW